MPLRPDFGKGRGIGWAMPLASIVRQRRSYLPAGTPDNSTAQWARAYRIGHFFGRPSAEKFITSAGSLPSLKEPPQPPGGGGTRIWASFQSAVVKYGSPAGKAL